MRKGDQHSAYTKIPVEYMIRYQYDVRKFWLVLKIDTALIAGLSRTHYVV